MSGYIADALNKKRELGKIIVLVALVGFAINVIATLVISNLKIDPRILWASASTILVFALIIYARTTIRMLSFSDDVTAAILIDRRDNSIIAIKGYEFSNDLAQTMEAIRAENKAIYSEWTKEPLFEQSSSPSNIDKKDPDDDKSYMAITRVRGNFDRPVPSSAKLAEEMSLFIALEVLSTHLSTYFNDRHGDKSIKEFSREDFPEFLLKNRILNMLSTPIEDRPIFIEAFPDPDNRPDGEIFSLWGSDGAVYSRFDLTSPIGSKLRNVTGNGVEIVTERLSLAISTRIGLSATGLTHPFCSRYIGIDWDNIEAIKIHISLKGNINPLFLLKSGGWDLYYWLDSFRDRLKKVADFEEFQARIHWHDLIEPLLFVNRRGQNVKQAPSPKAEEKINTTH